MVARSPHIITVSETVSTNEDAMRLGRSGESLPLWIRADVQTAGRGRSGRRWVSTPGNLHMSLAFTSAAPLALAGQISLVAGIALHDAVRRVLGPVTAPSLHLKWPNDLMVGAAKLGGILVESVLDAQPQSLSVRRHDDAAAPARFLCVVGFGLNVVTAPVDLDREATALHTLGCATTAAELAEHLASLMPVWLDNWDDGRGFAAQIRPAWTARAGAEGQAISVTMGSDRVSGLSRGIDDHGFLLIERPDGSEQRITHGDVDVSGGLGSEGTS